jgi:hypothetical protein
MTHTGEHLFDVNKSSARLKELQKQFCLNIACNQFQLSNLLFANVEVIDPRLLCVLTVLDFSSNSLNPQDSQTSTCWSICRSLFTNNYPLKSG